MRRTLASLHLQSRLSSSYCFSILRSTLQSLPPSVQTISTMPAEIKLTNLGIPYLVDFANVSIRAPSFPFGRKKSLKQKSGKASKQTPQPPAPKRCPTCGHLSDHPPVPEKDDVYSAKGGNVRPGGLYIRFADQLEAPTQKISERRLAKLRWAIAEAVTKVGMTSPASEEVLVAGDSNSSDGSETLRSTGSHKQTLFKGTYGQIKEALKNAGLATIPCAETGFENGEWILIYLKHQRTHFSRCSNASWSAVRERL